MKLDTWTISYSGGETARTGALWVDEQGVHFTTEEDIGEGAGIFVDYVDINTIDVDGDQLLIRVLDDGGERLLTFHRDPDGQAIQAIQERIAALVEEYTEPDDEGEDDSAQDLAQAADSDNVDDELQFDQAEYEGDQPAMATCVSCQQEIEADYYEVNGVVACPACKAAVDASRSPAGGGARFLKALTLGILAAGLGAGIYFGVAALTGYEIGLIAIVVGFLVGGAVRLGSEYRGGARYQVLAILLTYFAIIGTYVPLIARGIDTTQQQEARTAAGHSESEASRPDGEAATIPAEDLQQEHSVLFWVFVTGIAFIWPFAGLYFDGLGQIIGLLIVGFAVYEAWKLNKRPTIKITGPFTLRTGTGPAQEAPSPATTQPVSADG